MIPCYERRAGARWDLLRKTDKATTTVHVSEPETLEDTGLLQAQTLLKFQG